MEKRGYPFWVQLNRTDPGIHLAMPISLSRPCAESLYTRMSELWPRASLHLPERGKGEKAASKQKRILELLFLASPSYSFWSSCAKNVKNSECPLFIHLSVKYFFFPSGSDGNQCLMTHLRYSKTTRRERESKRSWRKPLGCVFELVCGFQSAHVPGRARARVCARHAPSEDGADVHAVALLSHCSTCLKKKGFSLFVSNFTGCPNGHRRVSKINK